MTAFDIPVIRCDPDEVETTVKITLNTGILCGIMEYIGGKRDGEMAVFGTRTIDAEIRG